MRTTWMPLGVAPRVGDRFFHGDVRDLAFTPGGRLLVGTALGWSEHDPDTLEELRRGDAPGLLALRPLADGSGVLYQTSERELFRAPWAGEPELLWIGGAWRGFAEGADGAVWVTEPGEPWKAGGAPNRLVEVDGGAEGRSVVLDAGLRGSSMALHRSPDGARLLLAGRLFDIRTGREAIGARPSASGDWEWAGSGALYGAARSSGPMLSCVDLSGARLGELAGDRDQHHLLGAGCDPTGTRGVLVCNGAILLLRFPTLEVLRELPFPRRPRDGVVAVAKVAVSATGWVVHDAVSGRLLGGRFDDEAVVARAGYPGDISRAASNGRITVWCGITPMAVMRLDHGTGALSGLDLPDPATQVGVGPDGTVLLGFDAPRGHDESSAIRLDPSGEETGRWELGAWVDRPVFSPDGSRFLLATLGRQQGERPYPTQAHLYTAAGKRIGLLKAPGRFHDHVITDDRVYFANAHQLTAHAHAKLAELWRWAAPGDAGEGGRFEFPGTSSAGPLAVLGPDLVAVGWWIRAMGGGVQEAGITLVDAGTPRRTWKVPTPPTAMLGFEGRLLVGWRDGRVEAWDGDAVTLLGRHGSSVYTMSAGPDGLWTVAGDGTVRRWDLPAGKGGSWGGGPAPAIR